MTTGHSLARSLSAVAVTGALMCLVTACGAETSTGAGAQRPVVWEEPVSYAYTLTSTSDVLAGSFRVEVHHGKVTKVVGLDEDSRRQVREPRVRVPTIGELLKRLDEARSGGADTAEAEVAADGHPVRISLDRDTNAVDDEALYLISAYGPVPASGQGDDRHPSAG
ncbi:DUF6174 domain-containing protein [Streptomyces sp. NPDC052301]|uniref:DUF6174 domain-containing protein n=1 Tax=Streptomyces sp. NPDC052301 TaxID=3365687 RepID=UPI0037CE9C69